ncbi:recombinase family protein [Altererythrobacter litoralis]|uniref:Recombinase family protein n=1 Tax=Altererythrobacter litoralis TaxID=3113904 RepID=A0ABU7GD10_9SPHN|nr:recombinase family protein [Erythrobacteraceae bacterium 1XM1-14]
MGTTRPDEIRCAVYTRKSSEEGLDQDFNSLDAQRVAADAYVASQAGEGWSLIPEHYDDGGFSGGNMERPGLMRLLADIEAGEIDVVVVYKIDRLTRSLTDFARIVEIFEKAGVSFVSVTQSFNTTSSMGRLMLNVLLSFAQFEREVTGERIRDKIAASKARGMWMGGLPPLGYDIPAPGSRTLRLIEEEAERVGHIFNRYLALGSVYTLQRELEAGCITSKRHVTQKGKVLGGSHFSRGALFHLLRNKTYLGLITHKGETHQGEHTAIIDQDLFDKVQEQLDANSRRRAASIERTVAKAPLTGKLFDTVGEPMTPAFARNRHGKLYRYYVSASLQQGQKAPDDDQVRRLPGARLDAIISELLTRWLPRVDDPLTFLQEVRLTAHGLLVSLSGDHAIAFAHVLEEGERIVSASRQRTVIEVELALPLRGGKRHIIVGKRNPRQRDRTLIAALRRAHGMTSRERGMPLVETAPSSPYDSRIQRLAFLAPDIQRAIVEGAQPPGLNLERLVKANLPISWKEQRRMLGFKAD